MAIFYIDNLTDKLDSAKELIRRLSDVPDFIGLDTETNGLDPFTSIVLLIQIKIGGDIYILNRGSLGIRFAQNILSLIKEKNIKCVGHNIKFDTKMLRADTGIELTNLYDTMIAEAILNAGIGDKYYSLGTVVNKYCNVVLEKDTRTEFISLNHQSCFTEQQIMYSALDVLYLFDIRERQTEAIHKEGLQTILELEMDVLPCVADMEFAGIPLDPEHWNGLIELSKKSMTEKSVVLKNLILDTIDLSKYENALQIIDELAIREGAKTKRDRSALEKISDPLVIRDWLITNFNMGSSPQLVKALNLCGIKTKSTNEKIINKLPKHPIIDAIIDFREVKKQFESYGYNVLELINPVTKRIHTDYFQLGTVTGRFSSSNPNLQNLPRKGGYREGFISSPGKTLLSMDYSQQEFRLAGATSNEPKIIEAYKQGHDMHTATAAIHFNKRLEDVTSEERNIGKTMNFAILYGTTAWGLKKNFNISTEDAEQMLKKFYDGYPVLSSFMNKSQEKILELGYSITPMGRKRYFSSPPLFCTPQEIERIEAQTKREGYNFIIQGGGADVTKLAMVKIYRENPFGKKFQLLLQVHDEVVAEVDDDIIEQAVEFMSYCMKEVFQPFLGEIPAKVDYKLGKRWSK